MTRSKHYLFGSSRIARNSNTEEDEQMEVDNIAHDVDAHSEDIEQDNNGSFENGDDANDRRSGNDSDEDIFERMLDEQEVNNDDEPEEDDNTMTDDFGSLRQVIRDSDDLVLCAVAGGCIDRDTDQAFTRRLSLLPALERKHSSDLWNFNKNGYSRSFICNACGGKLLESQKCCGDVAKIIRLPVCEQLQDLVEEHKESINMVRSKLRRGEKFDHNLGAPYFRQIWEKEEHNEVILSLLGSVDGVRVPNTRKKVWPITFEVLDLPSADMQKATNVVLYGIIECRKDPSTVLWNQIIGSIYEDVESLEYRSDGKVYGANISTWIADQPAKRSLFGMKSHLSSGSCFFCTSPGTVQKAGGMARYVTRIGVLTEEDSANSVNGFGDTPSKILEYCLPYDTPIDILHNFGEGILDRILKEIFTNDERKRKTNFFVSNVDVLKDAMNKTELPKEFDDIRSCRNGNTKNDLSFNFSNLRLSKAQFLQFYRIIIMMACLNHTVLSPAARIVCIALGMLINSLYTGCDHAPQFMENVTGSLLAFFKDANHVYMSIKSHEIIHHLAFVVEKFGNIGYLSTYPFESFYKYSLSDFKTSMTRFFIEKVCTRLQLSVLARREILRRSKKASCSSAVRIFVDATPDRDSSRRNLMKKLDERKFENGDDLIESEHEGYHGVYISTVGRLVSRYADIRTRNDVVFFESTLDYGCGRFVAAALDDEGIKLVIQPVEESLHDDRFVDLENSLQHLTGIESIAKSQLIAHLRSFKGVVQGKLSETRIVISHEKLLGVGARSKYGDHFVYIQINGCPVHP